MSYSSFAIFIVDILTILALFVGWLAMILVIKKLIKKSQEYLKVLTEIKIEIREIKQDLKDSKKYIDH